MEFKHTVNMMKIITDQSHSVSSDDFCFVFISGPTFFWDRMPQSDRKKKPLRRNGGRQNLKQPSGGGALESRSVTSQMPQRTYISGEGPNLLLRIALIKQ